MNLKQRFSLLFSTLFSILIAVVMILVYSLFSNFRNDEFKDRLAEKAETTFRLLLDVDEIDTKTLKIVDKNTINNLYNDKVLIFNDSLQLIYSSVDDTIVSWSKNELKQIKTQKAIFKKNGAFDSYGIVYQSKKRKDYYVLISAEDKYGNRKLAYLYYLLLGAFCFSTTAVWILSFKLSKQALAPLDILRTKISEITDKNLNSRLPLKGSRKDELNALANSFNQMLERIQHAYQRQKTFTANASHELRTPVARIVTQLENLMQAQKNNPSIFNSIKSVSDDAYQLSDIISSLLLLSKTEMDESKRATFSMVRLDEIIFNAAEQLAKQYPDFKFHFEIEQQSQVLQIEVPGDETLLTIACINLLKNGYLYADNQTVVCTLISNANQVVIQFLNTGETPTDSANAEVLFNPFYRGANTHQKEGSGLGLSIVKRILNYHGADIVYQIPQENTNLMVVTFCL